MSPSRRLLAASTALSGAAAVALQWLPHTVTVQAASDWLQLFVVVACAIASAAAARREEGEGRWFWLGVVGAVTLWAAGQVRYMLQGSAYFDGIDTVQNVLFLSVALPLLPALALHPDEANPARARVALDVAIVSTLAVFLYVYIGLSFPAMTDALAYERWRIGAGWVVSLAVVGAFVMRRRSATGAWRQLYTAIGIAMAVWFIGDSIVTVLMFENVYRPGLLDLPWLLPFVWMALIAGAWQSPARALLPQRETGWRDTRYGAVTALSAVAAPPLLDFALALNGTSGPAEWRTRTVAVLATTMVVAGLFLLRQCTVLAAFERAQQRRRAERRSSEERFTRAFHGVPMGAAILTESGHRIVDVNHRALELIGRSRVEAVGGTLDLVEGAAAATATAGGIEGLRGRPLRLRRHGGEVVEVLSWWQPIDADGERTVLVLLQDQREMQRLESQVLQAQKAEAVGRLAGSVAHDLNNLLTAIVGSTEVARQHLDEPGELATDLDHVVHAADRAASLTSRLLRYGHGQAQTPQAIDIASAVKEAERTVRQLAGDAIATRLTVPHSRLQVRIEPFELERILVNLVVNARDAMPRGGRLAIEVRCEPAAGAEPSSGRSVELVVSDTGEGISPALLTRVFEPFFTTKAAGAGSGLGLTTVRETAQRFGGAVFITSKPGIGTTVTVRLPAAEDAVPVEPVARAAVAERPASETVLLVEDEDSVREIVRRVLERQGYQVLEAASGPRALQLASDWPHSIDLLLTDVIMPDMNGPQLAERLARLRPGLRVLYASGYAADALGPMGLETREVALIHKPFTPSELTARVRQAIEQP